MSKRLTARVLLIGWDAADWHLIHPLIEAGQMPVLQRLIEYGTSGQIATLQPVLSPILWNSIATGKHADKHCILGFVEPTADGGNVRPVQSTSRRAKALWNILSQHGLRTSVVNWFASHPAEPIAGTVLTNRFANLALGPDGDLEPLPPGTVHPPELLDAAEDLRVHPGEITLKQLRPFFTRDHRPDARDPRFWSLAQTLAQCATIHNAATWLAARNDWDLLAVYYDSIDHTGHGFIEYHPPAMAHVSAEDAAVYGDVVNGMYRFHDRMLGRLLDLAGPESTVLLLSDHGFYSDHLRPAVREDLLEPAKKFGPEMNPVSWHRPHGIFVAAGRAIKHDELIHGASLLDIAPTVLTLLGLPWGADMDGRPLTHILADPLSEPERVPTHEVPHPRDGTHRHVPAEESDPFANRQALQQLAELGYVDLPAEGGEAKAVLAAGRDRRNNLAQVYLSTGRAPQAVELLRGLLAEKDNADLRCQLALALTAEGLLRDAEEVLAQVTPEQTKSPLRQLAMGQVRLAQGRLDEALALLEPLGQADFPLSHLHTMLGQIYARRGLLKKAEAALRRAIKRDDENAAAHDHLGTILRRTRRFEDAVYEHMRSAALQHARPLTHVHLGMALARTGQFDWAIRAFEVAVELAPHYVFAHRCLMHLYRRVKGDDAKARTHYQRARDLRVAARRGSSPSN
jgi:predicted AlkP superfamily phosphohydrolase/phosphomutase/tetratricopeptide (TPR) repeat protein